MVYKPKHSIPEEAIELSPEAKTLVADVRSQMESWIDEQVDRLTKEMGEKISQVANELNAQVEEVRIEFKAAREKTEKLLANIETLASNLESGDGETLSEAIRMTRDQILAVNAELVSREARWTSVGKGIVNTGLKAVSSIVNIPFLG